MPEGEEGVIRYVIGQIDEMDKDMHFPLDDGLNGWILKRNSHMIIEDMQESNVQRPRYHKGENQRHGLRSFIGIPLSCNDQAWASMTFESRIPGKYSEWTRNVISSLGVHLQLTIERIKLMQQLKTLRDTQPQSDSAKFQME